VSRDGEAVEALDALDALEAWRKGRMEERKISIY
jgi:hypothetical protein